MNFYFLLRKYSYLTWESSVFSTSLDFYGMCPFFPVEDKLEKQEKPVNGEDKGDSGVDTQNSEGNADEEYPLGPNCYYDKTKSFFDNISCDDNRYSLLSCF